MYSRFFEVGYAYTQTYTNPFFFFFFVSSVATEYYLKLTKPRLEKASLCLLAVANLAAIGKPPVDILVCSFPSCLNVA